MRWEQLFRELDLEWEAAVAADEQTEVADRTRAELARVQLVDRLRGAVGRPLLLHTPDGACAGELSRVAADCLLLLDGSVELLVPVAQVRGVEGLGPETVGPEQVGEVERRLGLGSLLRRAARDRAAVTVERLGSRSVHGTPVLVGADFVELAVHERDEVPRSRAVSGRVAVPFPAIVVVRREV